MRPPRPIHCLDRRFPRLARTALALALSALTTLAAAQDDVPARVGRIALTQGQVSIAGDVGAEMAPAQVNYPVTGGTAVVTSPGARTELRVGSTSIALDGDSSLEVIGLDDSGIRLRLNYGSASVRVLSPDAAAGFELETPEARVRLQQPATLRVDADRMPDTSAVSVFAGSALVDGGGSELTLRAGKRAELGGDDVRTMGAAGDGFDAWAAARDRAADDSAAVRYVGADMTGYEDLDRYGSWRVDGDYGPLWTPVVANDWVPYRDGSWTWLDPWGWTWVDNAPWGYAPFHYGRWVQVNNRWAWAPGRRHDHPVWSPALVGWVGGAGWNVAFHDRGTRPALGWYPLTPHDRFIPGYRVSESHLRWVNDNVRPDPRRPRDYRPQGLTVVPQDRFNRPGRVDVPRTPSAYPAPAALHDTPALAMAGGIGGAPGAPPPPPNRADRAQGGGWRARAGERGVVRPGTGTGPIVLTAPSVTGPGAQGLGVTSPTPRQPPQALGVTSPTPHLPPQAQGVVSPTPHLAPQAQGIVSPSPSPAQGAIGRAPGGWQGDERRARWDDGRRQEAGRNPSNGQISGQPSGQLNGQPGGQPAWQSSGLAPQAGDGRGDRGRRGDWDRRQPAAAITPGAAPQVSAPAPFQSASPVHPVVPQAPQAALDVRAERARRGEMERPHDVGNASIAAPAAMAPRPLPAQGAPAAPAAPRPAAERGEAGRNNAEQRGQRQQDR